MAKLTLADLRKIRDEKSKAMKRREVDGKTTHVIVGFGTCGIAAGAKDAFNAFLDEIDTEKLTCGVTVTYAGCMGVCGSEPTVEVQMDGMEPVMYGKVTPAAAKQIVNEHIIGRKVVSSLKIDKPAAGAK